MKKAFSLVAVVSAVFAVSSCRGDVTCVATVVEDGATVSSDTVVVEYTEGATCTSTTYVSAGDSVAPDGTLSSFSLLDSVGVDGGP